jgi:hypothetical protein
MPNGSTISDCLMIAGQGVLSMAFIISITVILRREPMSHVYQPKHFHDLGAAAGAGHGLGVFLVLAAPHHLVAPA